MKTYNELVEEHATLAAHVEHSRADKLTAATNIRANAACDALLIGLADLPAPRPADTRTTALAGLKAEWQAEALESVAGRYGHNEEYPQYCMHCILEVEAAELRPQADIMV